MLALPDPTLQPLPPVPSGGRLGGFPMMAVVRAVLRRIDLAFVAHAPISILEHAKEARLVALMAGGGVAVLIDAQQNRIGVAIDPDFAHRLEIARLLALAPQPVARAREVAGVSGGDRLIEGFAIHIRDHQQLPA